MCLPTMAEASANTWRSVLDWFTLMCCAAHYRGNIHTSKSSKHGIRAHSNIPWCRACITHLFPRRIQSIRECPGLSAVLLRGFPVAEATLREGDNCMFSPPPPSSFAPVDDVPQPTMTAAKTCTHPDVIHENRERLYMFSQWRWWWWWQREWRWWGWYYYVIQGLISALASPSTLPYFAILVPTSQLPPTHHPVASL